MAFTLSLTDLRSRTVVPDSNPSKWLDGSLVQYVDKYGYYAVGFVLKGELLPLTEIPGGHRLLNDLRDREVIGRGETDRVTSIGPVDLDVRFVTCRYYTGPRVNRSIRRRRTDWRQRRVRRAENRYKPVNPAFVRYLTSGEITVRVGVFLASFEEPAGPIDPTALANALAEQLPSIPDDEVDRWLAEFRMSRADFDEVLNTTVSEMPFSFLEVRWVGLHGPLPPRLGEWYIESVSTPGYSWTDPWSGIKYTASINGRVDPDVEVYGRPAEMLALLAAARRIAIRQLIDDYFPVRHRSWAEDRYHRTVWEAIIEHELKRRLRRFHSSTGGTVEGE